MEVLPFDQILVPIEKLPDPEADGGDSHLTLSEQVRNCRPPLAITLVTNTYICVIYNNLVGYVSHLQEQKWTDLALGSLAPDAALIDQLNITAI